MKTFTFFSSFVCLAALPWASFASVEESQEILFEESSMAVEPELLDVCPQEQAVHAKIESENTPPLQQEPSVSAQMGSQDVCEPEPPPPPPLHVAKKPGRKKCCPKVKPEKRWYIEVKPGYYYFTDKTMRQFFDNGGWTARAEMGYRFWKPLAVWLDAGYFQKKGHALGGSQDLRLKLATITLGLKGIFYWGNSFAFYGSAGPRLFMMLLHNDSTFVRSEDNQVAIGGGFSAGLWIFPVPWVRDLFLDLFADYSWKNMGIDKDENSSFNFDVNVSGITGGLGLGYRF